MLIRNAELDLGRRIADVRIRRGVITEIAPKLRANSSEQQLDAQGAALLSGLHDHHIHLMSLAASLESVQCGPPQVNTADELAARLRACATEGQGWIRGIGYHESVAGEIDRDWLDQHVATRPLRIQHRGGRLWVLNSRALELLNLRDETHPLEATNGRLTGRLYEADDWLRNRLGAVRPNLRRVSQMLASFGVTSLTDTTPRNGPDEYRYFAAAQQRGELLQRIKVMGNASLDEVEDDTQIQRGAHKFHLHEAHLPDFDETCAGIARSHLARRPAAFHCVTRAELVFALGALREAGALAGDRIEHAAVTPPELLDEIKALGLTVVTQPNFIAERGDAYLADVAADDQPWLYRLRSFLDAGVSLAGSTDAPFGDPNPWKAMRAAVDRRTATGQLIGLAEALSPEQALSLFTSTPDASSRHPRRVETGQPADLCLLDRPWSAASSSLGTVQVRRTIRGGAITWSANQL